MLFLFDLRCRQDVPGSVLCLLENPKDSIEHLHKFTKSFDPSLVDRVRFQRKYSFIIFIFAHIHIFIHTYIVIFLCVNIVFICTNIMASLIIITILQHFSTTRLRTSRGTRTCAMWCWTHRATTDTQQRQIIYGRGN